MKEVKPSQIILAPPFSKDLGNFLQTRFIISSIKQTPRSELLQILFRRIFFVDFDGPYLLLLLLAAAPVRVLTPDQVSL